MEPALDVVSCRREVQSNKLYLSYLTQTFSTTLGSPLLGSYEYVSQRIGNVDSGRCVGGGRRAEGDLHVLPYLAAHASICIFSSMM